MPEVTIARTVKLSLHLNVAEALYLQKITQNNLIGDSETATERGIRCDIFEGIAAALTREGEGA